jgi:nitroreductase
MDVRTALLTRASPGKLSEPAPDDAQLRQLLEVAVLAPDHGRLSPWRFVVMRGRAREHLADAMLADLLERKPAATEEERAAERNKALRSPLLVAAAAAVQYNHKIPVLEQQVAVAAAIQNLWIQAHAMGFGMMWKTGLAADSARVKAALGFAPTDSIIGILHLGTPVVAGTPRTADVASVTRTLQDPPR